MKQILCDICSKNLNTEMHECTMGEFKINQGGRYEQTLHFIVDLCADCRAHIDNMSADEYECLDIKSLFVESIKALQGNSGEQSVEAFIEELDRQLMSRIEDNYAEYTKNILTYSKEVLINMAVDITAAQDIYKYLKNGEYYFKQDELEYLLQFKEPLAMLADKRAEYISEYENIIYPINDILKNRDDDGDYERIAAT